MKLSDNLKKWPLIGNSHIIHFLSKSVEKNNIAGTYIFYGPDNLGKTTVANLFAQILLCENGIKELSSEASELSSERVMPCGVCSSCRKFSKSPAGRGEEADLSGTHSDLYLVKKEKDKKNISIEQTREFIRKLGMSSFLNSYKIGIIKHAHSLSAEAANALLKTLEEPKEKVVIILITSDIDAIPSTIVSRGQILKFNPVDSDTIYDYLVNEHKAARSAAKNFSFLCLGRPALAVKFLEDKEFYDGYLKKINIFLNFINQDVNERFIAIEDLMGKGAGKSALVNQEAVKRASRVLEVWLGLIRDMMLLEFNREDLMQHEIAAKELLNGKERLKLGNLLRLTDVLRQADKYLKANVNPRIVLENIAVNI